MADITGICKLAFKLRRLQWFVAFVLFDSTVATSQFRTSELQFSMASNVTMPTVIFSQVSLEQCWEECTARVACRAFNYFNLYKLCELNILEDFTDASTNRPVFGKSGVVHWTKQEFPDTLPCGSNTCNLGERCDQHAGKCETKECGPLLVSNEIVVGGNMNGIGSKVRLDCKEGYVPSFTKNIVECINTGKRTEHDMTCEVECEAGWRRFQTSCYQLCGSEETWIDAKSKCENVNAYLVSITSQEEYDFVHTQINEANVDTVWIGANDNENEGSWTWESGDAWDFESFAATEPSGGKVKNCLGMNENKGWKDYTCIAIIKRYLCEKKI
ncbi:neurocan core protein-like [Mya arenaria]|uniref:neurocan core protein-like n=1 Tax=Mya arenaria TaxID=6604 RepID=UPI0022E551F7|nr:neurocan core protein-like [Mya arenaria]